MKTLLFTFAAVCSAVAVPLQERQLGPTATISNAVVVGSSNGIIDTFNGIPFAQPPVGNLRLRPPQPITKNLGTITAVGVPRACPQFSQQFDKSNLPQQAINAILNGPFGQAITNTGEDCLTLNVIRPAGTSKDAKLPVLAWIYGGGFELGSTQMYDGSAIVAKSIQLGKPIIYVAINYRVGGFGFMAGKELANEGSTNLGLRDQRLGLQWIQDNIAAFGGDASKVTIWGESAGAISVCDHTLINNGDNSYNGKALFRGAIMNSGSIVPADTVRGPKAQNVYNTVVAAAGCAGQSDTLACLRSKDYNTFQNAVTSVPGILSYRSVDLAYLPRPDPGNSFFSNSPETSISSGKFTKVPIIIGDQNDEGTLFALSQNNITTTDKLIDYLASYFPTNPNARSDVAGLVSLYPDDPSAGSPFGTGPLYNIYPQYKRLAAILGDVTFTLTRRAYLAGVAPQLPAVWSYLATYLEGTPVLGTGHGTDIPFDFGLVPGIPSTSILSYYIAFVNNLDPNSLGTNAPLISWPKWTSASPNPLLEFKALANVLTTDNFRSQAYNYLLTKPSNFRV